MVNLTAVPEERSGKSLMFNVTEGSYKAGETVRMTLKANDFAKINGYQFTTNFDNQRLEFVGYESGKLHVTEENLDLRCWKKARSRRAGLIRWRRV
ncbi:MAG: hypothetical protein IPQ04_14475 [Saprospiraceae bacterium]|nr:hypothetical protein [Saprospiraceae bacterium]